MAGVLAVVAAVAWGLLSMLAPGAARFDDRFEEGVALYDLGEFSEALTVWMPLAMEGDARAQFQLGHLYRKGEGTEVNDVLAFDWTLRAAEQGDAAAAYFLARAYEEGSG